MRSHHRRETAAAEGAADARQFVDAILMRGEVPRVSTGSLRRPMRAVRQVNERLNGSRAGARLQANAIGHREPPVDTEERVSIVPLIVKQRQIVFVVEQAINGGPPFDTGRVRLVRQTAALEASDEAPIVVSKVVRSGNLTVIYSIQYPPEAAVK